MKVFKRSIALLALLGLSLSACGGTTVDWRQEVQLQDGRVIVVNRISKQTGNIFPENTTIEYEKQLNFVHPDTGEKIDWILPKGTGSYMLDFDGQATYVVLKPSSVADYNAWGCPNPAWVVYRRQAGQWSQVNLDQLPARFTTPNLLPAAKSDPKRTSDGVVSVGEFKAYLHEVDRQYRTIGREKINPIAKGCYDDVLIKQGRQSEINYGR